jgi:hypothetical protein
MPKVSLTLAIFILAGFPLLAKKDLNATAFRFIGPEVVKIDWNARALHSSDINGDDLADLVIVNRERSRIEILYRRKPGQKVKNVRSTRFDRWEPVLEDAPYQRENLSIDVEVTALATGDLDANGKVDLAYGGAEDGVFIRFREKDDSWSIPVEIDTGTLRSGTGSLAIRDLDGDGSLELLAHVKKGLEVFRMKGRESDGQPTLYRDDSPRSRGLHFADLDGDGDDDWLYQAPGDDRGVRTRLWEKSGFGPEYSHPLSSRSGVNLLSGGLSGKGKPAFVGIETDSRDVALFSVSPDNARSEGAFVWPSLILDLFSSGDDPAAFVSADFDGDKIDDMVAASSGAEILFLKGRADGDFVSPATFPSFSEISSLSSGRFSKKGGASLVLVSSGEKLVGVSRCLAGKRFQFPDALTFEDDPVTAVCADLDGNGLDEILLVTKERYDYTLHRFLPEGKGGFTETEKIELEGIKRDPSGIIPCDIDGDGNMDLLVLSLRDPAILLRGDGKGKLEPAAESSAIRKSMLANLTPARVGFTDVNEDGKADLLVTGDGFVRALTLKGDKLEVLDQFNSRSGKGQILAPFSIDVLGDKKPEILFYSTAEKGFEALSRDSDGVFRYARSIDTGEFDVRRLLVRKVGDSHELLVIGKSGFRRIPTRDATDETPVLSIHSRYTTDLRNVTHEAVDCGDFDSDGVLDLLCLDSTRHLLEFLRFDKEKRLWDSVLRFHVFESNLHYQGRKGGASEPREGLVLDLNGDGRDDFVLLVHDRLLCYYQE